MRSHHHTPYIILNSYKIILTTMSDATKDTDMLSARYDRISNSQLALGRALVDKMRITEGDAVVDIGCGTGRLTFEVAKTIGPNGHVIGLDPSPQRINTAKGKFDDGGHANIEFMVGEAEDLSMIGPGTADHVYYSSVFHWIGEKEKALSEAFRVLRPGGRMGITTIALDGPFTFTEVAGKVLSQPRFSDRSNGSGGNSHMISSSALAEMLAALGFVDVHVNVRVMQTFQPSVEKIIEFFEASSFGNFLRDVPPDIKADVIREMKDELERRRGPNGIEMLSNTMFALARKPASTSS
jgi:arsenite methyltransferase